MVTAATDKVSGLSLLLGHAHTHTHTHTHERMLMHTPTHKCMRVMQAHTCMHTHVHSLYLFFLMYLDIDENLEASLLLLLFLRL